MQYVFRINFTLSRWALFYLLVFALFTSLQSCSSNKAITSSTSSPRTAKKTYKRPVQPIKKDIRQDLVVSAKKYLGAKYRYGGKDGSGFDCSGLVTKVFVDNEIDIAGNSKMLAKKGRAVTPNNAKKGDLIFFKKQNLVNHVALIVDKSDTALWVIHSTSSKGVIKENIFASKYWSSKEYFIKDLL